MSFKTWISIGIIISKRLKKWNIIKTLFIETSVFFFLYSIFLFVENGTTLNQLLFAICNQKFIAYNFFFKTAAEYIKVYASCAAQKGKDNLTPLVKY